jgi:hypothetical protein
LSHPATAAAKKNEIPTSVVERTKNLLLGRAGAAIGDL